MLKKSIMRGYQSLQQINQQEIDHQKDENVLKGVTRIWKRKVFQTEAGLTEEQRIEEMKEAIKELELKVKKKKHAKISMLGKITDM